MNKFILKELQYGAFNYNPLPVVLKKGKGVYLTDINNKRYIDFLSGYSAINQGHCHPRLINVVNQQVENLTLTSRAFHNDKLGDLCQYICHTFNYQRFLPMNTGVEAGETAIKLARKWGYEIKKVQPNQAINLFCNNNFWGRTITALSSSNDPKCYNNYGPYTNGIDSIEYNNLVQLEDKLSNNPNIVSFMLEPIQGEAGIIVPDSNYLKNVKSICDKYQVLLIFDEVQTGLGRAGKLLACDYEDIRPDILILGKSLTGGFYPASGILSTNEIMSLFKAGEHGSTYGGNPLACSLIMEAIDILFEENLINNSYQLGKYFRQQLNSTKLKGVKEIRGKGLFNAIEFRDSNIANHVLSNLTNNGLLTQITHDKTIRLCPPLIITKKQIDDSLDILYNSINN